MGRKNTKGGYIRDYITWNIWPAGAQRERKPETIPALIYIHYIPCPFLYLLDFFFSSSLKKINK